MNECSHVYLPRGPNGYESAIGVCALCGIALPPTLRPFDKVKPGDTDSAFRAGCPKCDGHLWIFGAAKTSTLDSAILDPDKRICSSCGYVHWLRGPNES